MFAPDRKGVVVTEKRSFPRRLFFEALPEFFFERWPGVFPSCRFRAAGMLQGAMSRASSLETRKKETAFFSAETL